MRQASRFGLLLGFAAMPVFAQTSVTLGAAEGYGNLETAGAIATVAGDTNRNARIALQWRRSGETTFRTGQDLVRIDATHFVGSVFGLAPGTSYELRLTLSDPDGVGGTPTATATFTTRADTLVEPSLRTIYVAPAPVGNDANDGLSPGQAVATVQRGAVWVTAILRGDSRLPDDVLDRLPNAAVAALSVLRRADRPLSTGDVEDALGVARPTVVRGLNALRDEKLVVWRGQSKRDPRATWSLAD